MKLHLAWALPLSVGQIPLGVKGPEGVPRPHGYRVVCDFASVNQLHVAETRTSGVTSSDTRSPDRFALQTYVRTYVRQVRLILPRDVSTIIRATQNSINVSSLKTATMRSAISIWLRLSTRNATWHIERDQSFVSTYTSRWQINVSLKLRWDFHVKSGLGIFSDQSSSNLCGPFFKTANIHDPI